MASAPIERSLSGASYQVGLSAVPVTSMPVMQEARPSRYVRFWLDSEVAARETDVGSAPESRPQGAIVRFRPADDRSCLRSGHPGGGRRRPLLTHCGQIQV